MGTFRQVINTVGTTNWNVPTGVSTVTVKLWGPGGTGGAAAATFGGGGGKGGGYAQSDVSVTAGNVHKVIVANVGGNTVFRNSADTADTVRASGGNNGTAGGAAAGGAGATTHITTHVGTTTRNGGNGAAGGLTAGGGGGGGAGDTNAGGNASGTAGGNGGNADALNDGGAGGGIATAGSPGVFPGGAGGGGGSVNAAGGVGAQGKAELSWTAPASAGDDTVTTSDSASKVVQFFRSPGTKTFDSSGNARHGTLANPDKNWLIPSPFGAPMGKAIQFVGATDSSIDVGQAGTGVSGNFCFEFKVKYLAITAENHMGRWGNATSAWNYKLGTTTLGKPHAQMRKATGATTTLQGTTTMVAGTTYDLAVTYDGTTLRLYLDGVREDQVAATAPQTPDAVTPLLFGRITDTSSPELMNAIIEEVRLSNTARYTGASYTPSTTPFTTDANTLGLWHLDDVGDMVIVSDTITTSVGYGRVLSDTVTLSDVISKKIGKNFNDSVTTSDTITTKRIGKNLTDSVTVTDQITKVVAYKRSFSDSVTITDSISKRVTKVLADSISGSVSGDPVFIPNVME